MIFPSAQALDALVQAIRLIFQELVAFGWRNNKGDAKTFKRQRKAHRRAKEEEAACHFGGVRRGRVGRQVLVR